MHSPGRGLAVQGRGAQATALADALASLRRTRARMASLTAYDKDVSSASYNLSSATTGSYYSCVSQITIGYDVAGPVAIGLTHWKNPYVQNRPTLPSDLPLFLSKDGGIPVYHQSFPRKADLATPLSCPASLSITPVPSYSSSSQETLSQDTTGEQRHPAKESRDHWTNEYMKKKDNSSRKVVPRKGVNCPIAIFPTG